MRYTTDEEDIFLLFKLGILKYGMCFSQQSNREKKLK